MPRGIAGGRKMKAKPPGGEESALHEKRRLAKRKSPPSAKDRRCCLGCGRSIYRTTIHGYWPEFCLACRRQNRDLPEGGN